MPELSKYRTDSDSFDSYGKAITTSMIDISGQNLQAAGFQLGTIQRENQVIGAREANGQPTTAIVKGHAFGDPVTQRDSTVDALLTDAFGTVNDGEWCT
ncbi:hypothetical protein LTR95_018207 [Oleoguttula sp. CCFEE 5521]